MKIMTLSQEATWEKAAVAIGKFEGLHVGHQKLIGKIVEKQRAGYMPVAFTFDISPRLYFEKGKTVLFTREERRFLFDRWNVGCLVECTFDQAFASMEPEQFVEEILCRKLHTGYLVVGPDFCFGKNRRGDVKLLQKYEQQGAFTLEVVEKEQTDDCFVSSTRIRQALMAGSMEEVNEMLGFSYFLFGTVKEGNRLGRTWGIPTANIETDESKQLPPNGVYFTRVCVDGHWYCGITNVGTKPTVGNCYKKGVETYIYDFTDMIYGKEMTVELLHFHREEEKFASEKLLVEQLQRDLDAGKCFFFG